eukprot:6655922-Pyramimonas_sp.AAC.1
MTTRWSDLIRPGCDLKYDTRPHMEVRADLPLRASLQRWPHASMPQPGGGPACTRHSVRLQRKPPSSIKVFSPLGMSITLPSSSCKELFQTSRTPADRRLDA